MRAKTLKFGSKILISDPCYTLDDAMFNAIVSDMQEGEYSVKTTTRDGRVRTITITHTKESDFNWERLTSVGVDSGQCGFFDLKTYRNDSVDIPFADEEGKDFYESYRKTDAGDEWYGKICGYTLQPKGWEALDGIGLVSSSGYGDGYYDVLIAKDNYLGKGVGLSIKFF